MPPQPGHANAILSMTNKRGISNKMARFRHLAPGVCLWNPKQGAGRGDKRNRALLNFHILTCKHPSPLECYGHKSPGCCCMKKLCSEMMTLQYSVAPQMRGLWDIWQVGRLPCTSTHTSARTCPGVWRQALEMNRPHWVPSHHQNPDYSQPGGHSPMTRKGNVWCRDTQF